MLTSLPAARKSLPPLLTVLAIACLVWRRGRRRGALPPACPVTLHQATGVIGARADGYLRTLLAHLLTSTTDSYRVVTTAADLGRLFEGRFDPELKAAFADRLHVADLLEDAIEHLEIEAERIGAGYVNTDLSGRRNAPDVYWFATPGADSDVVHKTIQRWHGLGLVALLYGAWPYGPTHHLDGNRQVMATRGSRSFLTMSSAEAIAALRRPAGGVGHDATLR